MKKMMIFEPAMCCSTGVCGPSVDKELLRISAIINQINEVETKIERHNLTDNPMIFVENGVVNDLINNKGVDVLPITMVDGEVIKTGGYLSNQEIGEALEIKLESVVGESQSDKADSGCGCSGDCC